jgi:hypothetical protein
MHPYMVNFGTIGLPKDLVPGKYTVVITLKNEVADGQVGRMHEEKPVKFWIGKISAPAVTIEIPKPPASQPASQPAK